MNIGNIKKYIAPKWVFNKRPVGPQDGKVVTITIDISDSVSVSDLPDILNAVSDEVVEAILVLSGDLPKDLDNE